jgi:hypothetical protein
LSESTVTALVLMLPLLCARPSLAALWDQYLCPEFVDPNRKR